MENQNVSHQSSKFNDKDLAKFDKKAMETIKYSVIWSAITGVVSSIATSFATYHLVIGAYKTAMGPFGEILIKAYTPQLINFNVLINNIVWSIIGGAIMGYVIAKFYPIFVKWQKQYLGGKLDTFFKLLFWPYAVGSLIAFILSGTITLAYSGFIWIIVLVLVNVACAFVYAKMMEKSVGKYYL